MTAVSGQQGRWIIGFIVNGGLCRLCRTSRERLSALIRPAGEGYSGLGKDDWTFHCSIRWAGSKS